MTDTGVGMTPDQTERIFDAFTQADVTTTRKYGGTGLGLAIVSRFCQLMGGSVWWKAVLARVRPSSFSCPSSGVEPVVTSPAFAVVGHGMNGNGGATIMVVEDNEPSRDALSRRLERRGYRILQAGDGQQAVDDARLQMPDLILMDLGLPGIDGWDATRLLKGGATTHHIPIIVLSAHAMTNDRERALAAGGDDFDTKPVRFKQLLGRSKRC